MNLLQSLTLGIVQGLTEFLPISSTAHLKIVPSLLGWRDPGSAGTAVMQLERGGMLPPWIGIGVFFLYTAAVLALAVVVVRRRDA